MVLLTPRPVLLFNPSQHTHMTIFDLVSASARADYGILSLRCHALNLILGGGLPFGKIYEWFGAEGSGKSTLAYETMRLASVEGHIPVLFDMEDAASVHRLAKFDLYCAESVEEGLCEADQINMILVRECDSIESIFAWLGDFHDRAKKAKEEVPHLFCVIDSLGASPPHAHVHAKDIEATLKVGADALAWKNMLRVFRARYLKVGHSLLLLNHQTQKIDTSGFGKGPKYTSPGGHAPKHWANVRLQIIRVASLKNSDGNQIGAEVLVKVLKNRLAPPFQEARIPLYFGNPLLEAHEDFVGSFDLWACLNFCKAHKMITTRGGKSGMWVLNAEETEFDWFEWTGIQQFIDTFSVDAGLYHRLHRTMEHTHYSAESFSDGVIKPSAGPITYTEDADDADEPDPTADAS